MFCMRMGHIPQPVRAYGGSLLDRLPRLSPTFARAAVLRRRAGVHVLRIGQGEGFGGGGRCRSCVPPSRQRTGWGVPVSRVIARVCARGRGRAYRGGAARAPDCARETADAPRPSVPAGVFFAAPSHRFLQKRRKAAPGEPPLSTFILHHTAKCQAHPGTENENAGYFFMECRWYRSPSIFFPSCPDAPLRHPGLDPGSSLGSRGSIGCYTSGC